MAEICRKRASVFLSFYLSIVSAPILNSPTYISLMVWTNKVTEKKAHTPSPPSISRIEFQRKKKSVDVNLK